MSRHEEMCPHCRTKEAGEPAAPLRPITAEPADVPRAFRIHYPDGHTRDYTLHPDGRMTMAVAGQLLTTTLDFAFMAATSWAGGHIEWDPPPVAGVAAPVQAVEATQDAIPLPMAS